MTELATILLRRNVVTGEELAHAAHDEPRFPKGGGSATHHCRDSAARDAHPRRPYLGGYTVECSLKALILELTPEPDKADKLKKITAGQKMHRPDVLLGELRDLGVVLPLDLARRMRRFDWTTDLRYEAGRRDTGETIAFLRTAKAIYDWVEDQLP
jgi:hypothetical protein